MMTIRQRAVILPVVETDDYKFEKVNDKSWRATLKGNKFPVFVNASVGNHSSSMVYSLLEAIADTQSIKDWRN